jgi:hypothetical protein
MFERSPAGFARVSVAGVAIVLGLLVLSPWFYAKEKGKNHEAILDNAEQLIEEGQQTFRFDTFGDEEFWGGALQLHQAIAGSAFGGVGQGLTPEGALQLGLKVDVDALPSSVVQAIRRGTANLGSPATTLLLLKSNAVVGLTGFFDASGTLSSTRGWTILRNSR